jgi:AcrR family transcriptional regulator
VAKRLADGRAEELLDGVMRIIAARGFSELKMADLAPELHCSVATLYKIAPSKDSLIVLALVHWAEAGLKDMEVRAARGTTAVDRARIYWRTAAELISAQSHAFRADLDRFDSTRVAYRTSVSEPFLNRFVGLLDEAVRAGEIEPTNTCFLAHVFRSIAFLIRDEEILSLCGLTAGQAMLQTERMFWGGIGPAERNQSRS